jgi:hypothetical protein
MQLRNKSVYKSNGYQLIIKEVEGALYNKGKLLFKGNSKYALSFFLRYCEDGELKDKLKARFDKYEISKPLKEDKKESKPVVTETNKPNKRNKKV